MTSTNTDTAATDPTVAALLARSNALGADPHNTI